MVYWLERLLFLVSFAAKAAESPERKVQADEWKKLRKHALDASKYRAMDLPTLVTKSIGAADPDSGLVEMYRSLYSLRISLTHRDGLVSDSDAPDGTLLVGWRRLEMLLDGEPMPPLPARVEKGGAVQARVGVQQRTFQVGEQIHLTPDDCQEIAFTLTTFASNIVTKVHERLRELIRLPSEDDGQR